MRPILLALPLLLGGCCCGLGGGGGSSSSIGDRIEEEAGKKLGEALIEKTYEASTGHDMDISASGTQFVMETDDGKITTYVDGKVPDGFPCTMPSGVKVEAATRIDPKDPAKTPATWGITYTTSEGWESVLTYWKGEAARCGYTVSSTRDQLAAALKEAAAAGADMSAAGTGMDSGDALALTSTSDPSRGGSIMIDGSTPGTTSVVLSFQR